MASTRTVSRLPVPTVADLLAADSTFRLTVDLGTGHKVRLTGVIPDAVEVADLAALALDGTQPVDKTGRLKVSCPESVVVVDGTPTGRTVKRNAQTAPLTVAKCIYSASGLHAPEDLYGPVDPIAAAAAPSPNGTPAPV